MNNMMEKTNDIKLSIAFITHNRAKELIRAIESCIKYMVDKTEIIIWDNHSNKENNSSEPKNNFEGYKYSLGNTVLRMI